MSVTEQNGVIFVKHDGAGTQEAAEELCKDLHQAVVSVAKTHGKVAVYHDSSNLHSVTEGYARTFAKCFSEVKTYAPVQVSCIERSWLRVFAKLAITLSGSDMQFFSTPQECADYLRRRGFSLNGPGLAV